MNLYHFYPHIYWQTAVLTINAGANETNEDNGATNYGMWGDIVIKRADFPKIELGYALSCHKLQGSEAPYVIVGLDMAAKVLLTKEWLYTAITRAKKYCVVCGEDKAIRYAIATSHVPYKQTMLRGMLQEEFAKNVS